MEDHETYSEHLKRIEDHENANRRKCHFCQQLIREVELTKEPIQHNLICEGCIQRMDLGTAIRYVKGEEDKADPGLLMEFINTLYPQHTPARLSTIDTGVVNKSVKNKKK